MQILFGSTNLHKQKEVASLFSELPNVELIFPQDLDATLDLDPDETGETLEENAVLKARSYAEASGLPTLSEDSGLEIAALGGRPGVASKRFFPGTDQDRNTKILELLTTATDRSAQFRTVAAYFDPQTGEQHVFEGTVIGQIGMRPMGDRGFGYDPLFIPAGFDQSFAELGAAVKDSISHRARAFQAAKTFLQSF